MGLHCMLYGKQPKGGGHWPVCILGNIRDTGLSIGGLYFVVMVCMLEGQAYLRGVLVGLLTGVGRGVCLKECVLVCLRLGQSNAGCSSGRKPGWWERVDSPLLTGRLTFDLETPVGSHTSAFGTSFTFAITGINLSPTCLCTNTHL